MNLIQILQGSVKKTIAAGSIETYDFDKWLSGPIA